MTGSCTVSRHIRMGSHSAGGFSRIKDVLHIVNIMSISKQLPQHTCEHSFRRFCSSSPWSTSLFQAESDFPLVKNITSIVQIMLISGYVFRVNRLVLYNQLVWSTLRKTFSGVRLQICWKWALHLCILTCFISCNCFHLLHRKVS